MIKIVTWLLGFSSVIIGFYATGKVQGSLLLLVLGVLVSALAAFTALLYGAYATWNWAIADRIAEAYTWTEQCPDYKPIPKSDCEPIPKSKLHSAFPPWLAKFPLGLAKPCPDKIAPVFWVFFFASIVSLGVHVWLLFHFLLERPSYFGGCSDSYTF